MAVVTLDRPDRLNAWTGRMHTEYRAVFAHLEADPTVRAAVVTGAGRAFCAGADTAGARRPRGGRPLRPGHAARPGHPRPRRPPGVRPRLRLALRPALPGGGRHQRTRGRGGAGAGVLLRPAVRVGRRQAHHLGTTPGPPRRVRPVVGPPPPGGHRPRRRPAHLQPGGAGRGGRRHGPGQPGRPPGRGAGSGAGVGPRRGHRGGAVVGRAGQGPALRRPARRRGHGGGRCRSACSTRPSAATTTAKVCEPGSASARRRSPTCHPGPGPSLEESHPDRPPTEEDTP